MPVASRLLAALAGAIAAAILLPVTGSAASGPPQPIVCPNGICLPVVVPPQPVPIRPPSCRESQRLPAASVRLT